MQYVQELIQLYNKANGDVWLLENTNFWGFSNLRFLGNSVIWITSNEISKKPKLKVTLHASFLNCYKEWDGRADDNLLTSDRS